MYMYTCIYVCMYVYMYICVHRTTLESGTHLGGPPWQVITKYIYIYVWRYALYIYTFLRIYKYTWIDGLAMWIRKSQKSQRRSWKSVNGAGVILDLCYWWSWRPRLIRKGSPWESIKIHEYPHESSWILMYSHELLFLMRVGLRYHW